MKPFLGYGWQPQIMAIEGRHKAILSGTTEVYDVIADPAEGKNLGAGANLSAALRKALDDYPVPSPEAARAPENLSDEAKRNLASLGYVSASTPPVVRKDAPRPADMVGLFDTLEKASGLFVAERYAQAIPLLEKILAADPVQPRCRAAPGDGVLVARPGREGARRVQAGRRDCAAVARRSNLPGPALRSRQGLAASGATPRAHRRRQSRTPSGGRGAGRRCANVRGGLRKRSRCDRRSPPCARRRPPDLVRLGQLAMQAQKTTLGIESFEGARSKVGPAFTHDLELGVLYLSARRFTDARNALDRVPPSHPEYPMALFKRAQVGVLLKEPDSAARIARARQHADRTTRELIARERLFQ